ncbi:hypothetical protein UCDDS831_g06239 [Diplodia seriata]|uniref:Hydrophobin n=1 Tax=Diplodia seriata TaxID=420778 RepID=A0A0G2GLP4_9PEZI|nr:hypothetical protein UCDDS831_g06239 [Diplodia seriata]
MTTKQKVILANIQYTDPNAVDWKEPQGWAPPAHFDWSVLAKSRAANPKYGDDGGAGYRRYKRKAGGGGGAGYGDEGHDDEGHDDGGYEGDESDDDDGGAAGVCSGNSNVASCCAGGACSVLPGPVLSGLLNVGGIGALTSSGCQAQQQVSCCPQNGGGLLNVQSCGPLIDIL